LSSALAEVVRWSAGKMPIVFFDEFDSSLGGAPLGWLQWLLAPMQDGVIFDHANPIELRRGVYVFAGGTADRFEGFPAAHESYFRSAKGPDFLSRLRGHMNIRGPNDWPYRRVRRAILLRRAVERVAPDLLNGTRIPKSRMADTFINQLLAIGRYRHGARSVEAIVEMSTTPTQAHFSDRDLPAANVRANHVDLGPLGGRLVALSAGGSDKDFDKKLERVWPEVATRLLELGAGLIYGGNPSSGGFTDRLGKAESALPGLLGTDEEMDDHPLSRPRAGRVTWVRSGNGGGTDKPPSLKRVEVCQLPDLSKQELAQLKLHADAKLSPKLIRALALFRMRVYHRHGGCKPGLRRQGD
jgi:hypothetical protein